MTNIGATASESRCSYRTAGSRESNIDSALTLAKHVVQLRDAVMPGLGLLGCFCQYSGTDNQSCASPVSAASEQLYRALVFAAEQRVGEFLKEVPPPLALWYLNPLPK